MRTGPVVTSSSALIAMTAAVAVNAIAACAPAAPSPRGLPELTPLAPPVLTVQQSGTSALLQAISPVSDRVVWASGHDGSYTRTLDGGATWTAGRVPGADTLQFRDVHAVSADTAYLMSAGNGPLSRIFRTSDGGRSWVQQHLNAEPEAFFDCMAFWNARTGVVFSDAVGGRHFLLRTSDGGAHWERILPERLPSASPGEGGFAASGTCLIAVGPAIGFAGTGNAPRAEVLKTIDAGRSWSARTVPVVSGEAAGIASVAFRDATHGVALGGEIGKPAARGDYVAITADGGDTWSIGGRFTFAGAAYGAAYVPGVAAAPVVAVGPKGADISRDDGRSWTSLDTAAYWSVAFASARAGWAVGPRGRIVKIQLY
jgi:photosystem II stability/assembly factor-like uncharacterized protein